MNIYESLAEEMIEAFDRKKRPPINDMSAAMRGEMAVLRLLTEESRALTAGEISSLLAMTTSRIAAVLGALERKGLIVRSADERDKRRVLVTLTQEGLLLSHQRKQCLLHAISQTLAQIGEADAREFVRLMKRVYSLLPPPIPACGGEKDIGNETGMLPAASRQTAVNPAALWPRPQRGAKICITKKKEAIHER